MLSLAGGAQRCGLADDDVPADVRLAGDSLVRVSRRVLKVPKAVASPTGNQGASPRDIADLTASQAPGNGTQVRKSESEASLSTSRDALRTRPNTLLTKISTVGQSGRETPAVRGERELVRAAPRSTDRAVWPTPNGSRRPTRGEVHDGDAGRADAATACQRPRPPTSRITRKPTSR
ncbi:unnamed protein product [Trichogramma brassicae]|uniref:Uncharacterized protein n=1 Tax=Trichogramma brassicae TaxID=86971 RepID=A0A6H5J088_9HYME|nr:unnamed protein product [Trichogramma brassicae]